MVNPSSDPGALAPVPFDHLVVMLRDELGDRAPAFERDGFHLTPLSVHNIGSMNRLVVLDSSYIELMGWPAGKPPERKEIAGQPLGIDALVFRSDDAEATHARLVQAGFEVTPVQRLERPLQFKGAPEMARFDTVRFSVQPVPGIRMYFCRHLTPQFVWDEGFMHHGNGAVALEQVLIEAPDPQWVAGRLAAVCGGTAYQGPEGAWQVDLPNLQLMVRLSAGLGEATIAGAVLRHQDGAVRPFNTHL